MSYNKTTWQTGDVITAEKLNNMEGGITNAGSSNVLVINIVNSVFDKTWQEIHDALNAGKVVTLSNEAGGFSFVVDTTAGEELYSLRYAYMSDDSLITGNASTDSADGYPAFPPH